MILIKFPSIATLDGRSIVLIVSFGFLVQPVSYNFLIVFSPEIHLACLGIDLRRGA